MSLFTSEYGHTSLYLLVFKADLPSANFSRMTHFAGESLFEANEIWIICKATCFTQKANYNKKTLKIKKFFDFRSTHQRCSAEKGFLKNFENFTGKHLRWSLFLIKLHTFSALQLS